MSQDLTVGAEGAVPEAAAKTLLAADIMKILSYLPHRYPFLLVDRIEEIDSDLSGVGVKNVTFNEPHFQGHFPSAPVMPGVLLVEGMAQTAGCMCIAARTAKVPQLVYFMTIDKTKFRKPVTPGDVVRYHMTQIKKRANMWWFRGEAKVDGKIVCEAEISAMIVDS
ncbi:3-hydroxyacyl-ACP dehydratase FabZ [Chelatococcus sambhunathii]|uniref:3-hydroxyacyl-[acyl-carrier-protein] dehydratase FabZ n=1 Tax=Chelatococcus sambhunathii TaxID=363953 RepID=A0ABU1DJJ0_9HYPH|nr:3-hydroxyacyl-ACP dehydratase FabZ [Chelatococcus sambhunathii]MDR4308291.1 3-hydroxyacyl-ACP dehydratase FabZ [Chelatococcus sambhunathii]